MRRLSVLMVAFFLLNGIQGVIPTASYADEILDIPDEALTIFQDTEFRNMPLSGMGQRVVKSRFALYYQEKIICIRMSLLYEECEKNLENRDCEKEYMALFNAGKKKDNLRSLWQREYTSWRSNWLTRLGIPNLPDVSTGQVDVRGEAKKEYDLYVKWRDANDYLGRLNSIQKTVKDKRTELDVAQESRISAEQKIQEAQLHLNRLWAQISLEEEYMCRYMISILGKIPSDCFVWRKKVVDDHTFVSEKEDPPKISISLVPKYFFRPGETLEVFVRVIEPDGKIISGTSVLIGPRDFPEEVKEYLTDYRGIARAVLKHDEKDRTEYFYTAYIHGTAISFHIPVMDLKSLRQKLNAIPAEGQESFALIDEKKHANIQVHRSKNEWTFKVTPHPVWENRDFITDKLKSAGYANDIEESGDTSLFLKVQGEENALDLLIQTVKTLEWIVTEEEK